MEKKVNQNIDPDFFATDSFEIKFDEDGSVEERRKSIDKQNLRIERDAESVGVTSVDGR